MKTNELPRFAIVKDGRIKCPNCKRVLAKAYYGAVSKGVEIKCRCGTFVLINIDSR